MTHGVISKILEEHSISCLKIGMQALHFCLYYIYIRNISAEMNDIDCKQKFTSLTVNQIIGIDIRLTTNVNKVENSK